MLTLTPSPSSLSIPGCKLLSVGLDLDSGLSKEQTESIGRTLNTMSQCALWWWGDFINHIKGEHGSKYAESVLTSGYSYSSLTSAKWVCSRIDISNRLEKLTFSHHYEALIECGENTLEALEWLTQARDNAWSVAQMRVHMRKAHATKTDEQEGAKKSPDYEQIEGLRQWARTAFPQKPPEVRARFIQDLEGIITEMRASL